MLVTKPPMGWNSWNTFGENISDALIRETADAMVDNGLLAAGYQYLVIDDCWSMRTRDENGRLRPDPVKFPNGIKPVADYVHSKGLKFGMYSCAGSITCAHYPGSFDHEFVDAQTFAEWGVDFLKYDYCFHSPAVDGKVLYRRMGTALETCGRDILFSACTWGVDDTETWIKETSASMWRSTQDIHDDWENIKELTRAQYRLFPYHGPGCFNDMDMLVVGIHGGGGVGAGMNDQQYRTHFSIWSMFMSPLIIGCDVRHMTEETKKILLNPDIIAMNQDPSCRQVYKLKREFRMDCDAFVRQLANGEFIIGIFNLEDWDSRSVINLSQLGLSPSTHKTLKLRELWTGEELTVSNSVMIRDIPLYGCEVWRGHVVDD